MVNYPTLILTDYIFHSSADIEYNTMPKNGWSGLEFTFKFCAKRGNKGKVFHISRMPRQSANNFN